MRFPGRLHPRACAGASGVRGLPPACGSGCQPVWVCGGWPSRLGAVRSGFTLIEILISSALMALILVSGFVCLDAAFASQKAIEPRIEVIQNARVAMALMSADLRNACPLSKEYDFLGMHRMLGDAQADNLDFATHNYTPRHPGEGDFCQTSLFLEKDRESGQFTLWRRRNPRLALDPLAGGTREEIATGLRGLKFEYYDGYEWYDSWGDAELRGKAQSSRRERYNLEGLPEAVRITLWFDLHPGAHKSQSAEAETNAPPLMFQTVARLNLADVPQPSASSAGGNTTGPGNAQPVPGPGQ